MGKIISLAAARAANQSSAAAWNDAVDAFLDDMEVEGKSERTIGGHRGELRRYDVWLQENGYHWASVTPAYLSAYSRTRAKLKRSSRASLICTMRVFYRWCVDNQKIEGRSPAEHLKTPKRGKDAPRSLTGEQVKKLLAHLDRELEKDPSVRMVRDRALVLTGLYTGLRAAELAALHWSAIDFHNRVITVYNGKGEKGRSVRLKAAVVPILTEWRTLQDGPDDGPVFSLSDEPIRPNRAGKIVRRHAKATNLPLTTHVLRHTFATTSLRKSGNIYSVSKALGHARLAQTEVYLRTDPSDGDEAIDSLPELDEW